ncbi:MAG: Lrp/AsnC family transcriptional regulator [Candidatus Bathyarchaeia archaeon]
MGESYEDKEWVVKGPHASMVITHPIEDLEGKILSLLEAHGRLRLSQIWRMLNCHLWEASFALKRLKDKGLVNEEPLNF